MAVKEFKKKVLQPDKDHLKHSGRRWLIQSVMWGNKYHLFVFSINCFSLFLVLKISFTIVKS